jgi:hypothetical protein
MCQCTPEIKTPFCGRPGCEWPPQRPPEPHPPVVHEIVGEISAMEYAGDVKAIIAAVIDKDGDLRTFVAYNEGQKFPLIAAAGILQHQVIAEARTFNKKRD